MPIRFIQEFIKLESSSGILLCCTAVLGLIAVNSPMLDLYNQFFNTPLISNIDLNFIINDGLMVLFFLLVGLEIKREMNNGELNSIRKILLPGIAAIGGMIIPALVYLFFNFHNKHLLRGWAIPTATDIAFALAMLSLLGKRVPFSIKIFLTALAIFDDIGAIIIIAVFYTQTLAWLYLGLTALCLCILLALRYYHIKNLNWYILTGILLWYCVLRSGIHPTIAGVLFAFLLPIEKQTLEHHLHPWVAYLILPLFAFANTGIPLTEFNFAILVQSLPLGIILGLFIGKQFGVFLAVFTAVKCRIAKLPTDCTWLMMYATALLCGIGFTMSLFIGNLAFTNENLINATRLGVLVGSLLSGICGYLLLRLNNKSNAFR